MLTRLVQFALAQRLFVLIAGLVLMAAGWLAFKDLPIDAFPDVSSTQVKVIMKAPGMTPEDHRLQADCRYRHASVTMGTPRNTDTPTEP